MNPETLDRLRALLRLQPLAALGTLRRGEPQVSMAPFALDDVVPQFLIHVSALATHTRDMLEHPRVSLLVVAPEDGGMPQQRARATIAGEARPLDKASPGGVQARALYQRRFPEAAGIFELPDFTMFAIRPLSVRFIGGFAQATSLTAEQFAAALRGGA
jgi:putative heme iron utilization protein